MNGILALLILGAGAPAFANSADDACPQVTCQVSVQSNAGTYEWSGGGTNEKAARQNALDKCQLNPSGTCQITGCQSTPQVNVWSYCLDAN